MTGDDKEGVQPWTLVPEGPVRDLIFSYEAVLTEMRTHARAGDRTLNGWVSCLDFARDEFCNAQRHQESEQVADTEGEK